MNDGEKVSFPKKKEFTRYIVISFESTKKIDMTGSVDKFILETSSPSQPSSTISSVEMRPPAGWMPTAKRRQPIGVPIALHYIRHVHARVYCMDGN